MRVLIWMLDKIDLWFGRLVDWMYFGPKEIKATQRYEMPRPYTWCEDMVHAIGYWAGYASDHLRGRRRRR